MLANILAALQRRLAGGQPADRLQADIDAQLARCAAVVAARRAARPTSVEFPPELPITAHLPQITAALQARQVVVVCGETGSGKTTQLAKLCLHLGRGVHGRIGHTQPRRIAARAVAARLAVELGAPRAVGYSVRFNDTVSDSAAIQVMTDGLLLAHTQSDPHLLAYDTLIIDEAHERSLNIDFLLGYLHRLLPRRPDLRLIITSATIDPQRFAQHFGDAPIIEVSGRGHPVEVRYRPLVTPDPTRRTARWWRASSPRSRNCTAKARATCWCSCPASGRSATRPRPLRAHGTAGLELLPLYARLSRAEQDRVFAPAKQRRVVLATNVAETSLTVPGIRYVVDSGLARVSRYGARNHVQRLGLEKIAQAAADQRAGRCGRLGPGVCIRLYAAGRLRQPQSLYRPRNPPRQPGQRGAAHAGPATGRGGGFPVPGPAAAAPLARRAAGPVRAGRSGHRRCADRHRSPTGTFSAGSFAGAHADRGRQNGCAARSADHHRRADRAGPARATARSPGSTPTRYTDSSPTRARISSPCSTSIAPSSRRPATARRPSCACGAASIFCPTCAFANGGTSPGN